MSQVKFDFRERVALVTGATSGIGRAAAIAFAAAGAQVVAASRNAEEGRKTLEMIETGGGQAVFRSADVTREADLRGLVDLALERYGRLDYALNTAGGAKVIALKDLSEEDWDGDLARNLKSVYFGMKHQLAAMERSGGGAIVNFSSTAALLGLPGYGAYTAAKGGLVALTRAAAAEGAPHNIRVNSISVGAVFTNAWAGSSPETLAAVGASVPLGRMGRPEELAAAALWLCSDGASFVTGHCLVADGGATAMKASLRTVGN